MIFSILNFLDTFTHLAIDLHNFWCRQASYPFCCSLMHLVIVWNLVNYYSVQMRSGYGRSIFEPLLPLILGRDISGEVAAIGASVRTLNVGQEVFGALHPTAARGTYVDYAILSEDELTPKPVSITHVVNI